MKKVIVIVLVSVVSLFLIGLAGLIIFVKTFDANSLKPKIVAAAADALGRKFDFKNIILKLSLKGGVELALTDAMVGEHPDFGTEDFLTAKDIGLTLSITDLIFKRQISVSKMKCVSPRINIIRLKDGRLNIQAFKPAATADEKEKPQTQKKTVAQTPALLVEKIILENGQFSYRDNSFEPSIVLTVDQIKATAEMISFTDAFPFTVQARFASSTDNIFCKGTALVDLKQQRLVLREMNIESDLSALDIAALIKSIEQLKDATLTRIKSGVLTIGVDECEISASGLGKLKGKGKLSNGSLFTKEFIVPVEPIEVNFTINDSEVAFNNTSFSIGKARADLTCVVKDFFTKQNYELKVKVGGFDFQESVDQAKYPVKVKGIVESEFELKGEGFDTSKAFPTMMGGGFVQMKDGSLTNMNVLRLVMDKLSVVPNLPATLEANLPERYKELLSREETGIAGLRAQVSVGNNVNTLESLTIETDAFSFQGKGTMSSKREYKIEGTFIIPQDLSTSMVTAVPQIELLLDESKQVRFPLIAQGQDSRVTFMPDIGKIGTSIFQQKGVEGLMKVLDKALEKKDQNSSAPATTK